MLPEGPAKKADHGWKEIKGVLICSAGSKETDAKVDMGDIRAACKPGGLGLLGGFEGATGQPA